MIWIIFILLGVIVILSALLILTIGCALVIVRSARETVEEFQHRQVPPSVTTTAVKVIDCDPTSPVTFQWKSTREALEKAPLN